MCLIAYTGGIYPGRIVLVLLESKLVLCGLPVYRVVEIHVGARAVQVVAVHYQADQARQEQYDGAH